MELVDVGTEDGLPLLVPEEYEAWSRGFDWEWDPLSTCAIHMEDDGTIVYFHNAVIREATRRGEHLWPRVSNSAIDYLLGQAESFATLGARWAQLARAAPKETSLPNRYDFLGLALTVTVRRYYEWAQSPLVSYWPDEDGITPGELLHSADTAVEVGEEYERCGPWFKEYTGNWKPDTSAPTGIAPETFYDLVQEDLLGVMVNLGDGIYELYQEAKPTLDRTFRHVLQAMKSVPLT